jgi:hypothetical protein
MDFLKVTFQCTGCEKKSDIFFEPGEGINGVFDKVKCRICSKEELIGVGDLGYRNDYPNPDCAPWQPQFIRINYKSGVCFDCSISNSIVLDYLNLVTNCYNCGSIDSMKAIRVEPAINNNLESLIKN